MADTEISVVVHLTAQPGREAELLQRMKELLEPTRREPGCIRYELNQEIGDSAAFTFAEKFVDRAAFESHLKNSYSIDFFDQLSALAHKVRIRLHHELLATRQVEALTGDDAVIVIAHFTAKLGKEKELQDFLESLVAPTRLEPGCIRYEVSQDIDDPTTFTFVETFANQAGFEAHCATSYVARLFELMPLLVEEKYIELHRRISA